MNTWALPLNYQYRSYESEFGEYMMMMEVATIWLFICNIGWIFSNSVNLVLPLQERVHGARQLQYMAGSSLCIIWFSYFLVDAIFTTIVAIFALAAIFPFDTKQIFTSGTTSGVLFSIFLLYGVAGTVFAYFVSFLKKKVASAFGFLTITSILIAFGNFTLLILELKSDDISKIVRMIFGLVSPHFALASSLTHFSMTAYYNSKCRRMPEWIKKLACGEESIDKYAKIITSGGGHEFKRIIQCCEKICGKLDACFEPASYIWSKNTKDDKILKHGAIGQEFVYFLVGSVVWISIVLLLDSGILSRMSEKILSKLGQKFHPIHEGGGEEDNDVEDERQKVEQCMQRNEYPNGGIYQPDSGNQTILTVSALCKHFGVPVTKSRFPAVRGVSFRVEQGECFGLLGVNGAGKSTTFQMLTGATAPTEGDALLGRCRLRGDRSHFLSGLGYCPQTDAQLDILTGKETLQLYARLRGVPKDQVDKEVKRWSDALGFTEYVNRQSSTYSGGNKRKLSVAMAMIGDPPVALLDEPTSGVDPIARRQLWQALAACQRAGQSIILTSHSMDECEALCSRLGIMVAGKLVCLGPIGHLKDRYGQGYTLMVKVKSVSSESDLETPSDDEIQLSKLKSNIEKKLAPCELVDEHKSLLHYHIQGTGRKWSEVFKQMEALKKSHSIMEDYSLSETTLEQVFLSFAQKRDKSQ